MMNRAPNTQTTFATLTLRSSLLILASAGLFACNAGPELDLSETESLSSDLSVVECRPNDPASCDRGEGCLGVGSDPRTGEPTLHVCAADRCTSTRECREGYVCRANHCLRVERDRPEDQETRPVETRPEERPDRPEERPDRACPRGTVPGIPACAEGYEHHVISREPLCSTCEPVRPERPNLCDPARPTARGECRAILGYFWDGRVCVGLGGCEVVDATGLYRSARQCAQAHLRCQ